MADWLRLRSRHEERGGLIEFALVLMFHLGNPASLVCGTWLPIANSWPPTSRDNDGTSRDWLGVEILYNHDWKTGASPGGPDQRVGPRTP
jgi:hypothetical protein